MGKRKELKAANKNVFGHVQAVKRGESIHSGYTSRISEADLIVVNGTWKLTPKEACILATALLKAVKELDSPVA